MGAYILEQESEVKRLEKQNAQAIYSIKDELAEITTTEHDEILDAGCGTGGVTRHLVQYHSFKSLDAIDFSQERLRFASKSFSKGGKNINFIQADLNNLDNLEGAYNLIISRFVMHHLEDPSSVVTNLANHLKPTGELVIVDSDGILFNFYCRDQWVLSILDEIKSRLRLDMFVARKMKVLMFNAGLRELDSRIIPMHFKGADLQFEKQQYFDRFEAMSSWFDSILGCEKSYDFQRRYLAAFDEPDTEIFYNKFITRGKKQPRVEKQ